MKTGLRVESSVRLLKNVHTKKNRQYLISQLVWVAAFFLVMSHCKSPVREVSLHVLMPSSAIVDTSVVFNKAGIPIGTIGKSIQYKGGWFTRYEIHSSLNAPNLHLGAVAYLNKGKLIIEDGALTNEELPVGSFIPGYSDRIGLLIDRIEDKSKISVDDFKSWLKRIENEKVE
jgi:hypothetical protein